MPTLGERLGAVGYKTGAIGKWHLGRRQQDHPNRRGFGSWFGAVHFHPGYLPDPTSDRDVLSRNDQVEPLGGELTARCAAEASRFIEQASEEPWLLYVAFHTPHNPLSATEEALAGVAHIEDSTRRLYAAVLLTLDDAIGEILDTLR